MGGQTGGGDARASGPGGGLGPPSDAPDPLQKYRWWIISGFIVVLCGGAYYVATRQPAAVAVAGGPDVAMESPEPPAPVPSRRVSAPLQPARNVTAAAATATAAVAPPRPSMLLEALKEEIFQLEVEHKQGKITQQEYEKAKAALDGTLERAIKRDAQKV